MMTSNFGALILGQIVKPGAVRRVFHIEPGLVCGGHQHEWASEAALEDRTP